MTMKSNQIRTAFLDFFAAKGHTIVASDKLVPENDASVLFTSAGMNQFKEQFMGKIGNFRRAASCQKCLRTADLVNVGKSPTHHTFFEMLGNFSFGDYFKKDAIAWAWEFVTTVLKLPEGKLWVSVHNKDKEAYKIWKEKIGITEQKIIKLGDNDNFWPADAPKNGPNGPCGPCSEIFFDWGEKHGCGRKTCNPACDCTRFTEIWNLVFTQYDRQPDGTLNPLPSKNIDTGMGLERVVSVMQNVRSNYETDLFAPVLSSLMDQLTRAGLSPDAKWQKSQAKAVVDHIRAATFAIGDGIVPSNEARGYVIRKLIRRAIMNVKQAGINKPLCFGLVYPIGLTMKEPYPEINRRHETIAGIIKKEEEMFWTILNERAPQNELTFRELSQQKNSSERRTYNEMAQQFGVSEAAAAAFVQYDTYGVPPEISKENAGKYNLEIDDDDIERLMDEQRRRSRSKTQISSEIFSRNIGHALQELKTEFVGYETLQSQAKILAVLREDALVDEAEEGSQAAIVLDVTPFYAEAGGQVGDKGLIDTAAGTRLSVADTVKIDDVFLHKTRITKGTIKKGDVVTATVTTHRRVATARNHTATHLLQYALRNILGEHVEQSGSYVTPDKLRFDFSHLKALKPETIENIEETVNECIMQNLPVTTQVMSIEEAKNTGALAIFGEKYGRSVRVISIGDISKELCGGTHVRATGEIGLFKITSESSVAQGIRRIEACTGLEAFHILQRAEDIIRELGSILKAAPDKITDAAAKLLNQNKQQEKELHRLRIGSLSGDAKRLLDNTVQSIHQIPVVISELKNYDMNALRKMSDLLRNKKDPVICVLAATGGDTKPLLVVAISHSLAEKGIDAVKIIRQITARCGGGGGGNKELAQAGAKDSGALRDALQQTPRIIENFLKDRGKHESG